MANEVIIEEYGQKRYETKGVYHDNVTGVLNTTQVLTIATLSAAFDARTSMLRVRSKGTGFWYKIGGSAPDAVANTAGNCWLPADQYVDVSIIPGTDTKIDTAA